MTALLAPEQSPADKLGPDSGVKPRSEEELMLLAQHRANRAAEHVKEHIAVEHLGTIASSTLVNPAEQIPTQDLREADAQERAQEEQSK